MRFLVAPLVLALFVPSLVAQAPPDVALKAKAVFEKYCHYCHGKDGSNDGGFNYIMNLEQMLAKSKVVPNDAKGSKLYKKLVDEKMPPAEDGNNKPIVIRPTADDIAAVKAWIEAGAPDFNAKVAPRAFIANAEILESIHKDLLAADKDDREFLRYFTITHLSNAGLSPDELKSYRVGLSKLVNSLSWKRKIKEPKPIDPAQTILRIDLRDYNWNEKTWERILAANPYGVVYQTEAAKGCSALSRTTLPHVRADWFVFAASRPPLYHDVLELPKTDLELEKKLEVNVAEHIRTKRVARAGFKESGVSDNNRMIERHESAYGAYWKSYDFKNNQDRRNLFAYPLGPGSDANSFQHDGGEIIFNLPNGLQAYFLTDAKGGRIDEGPTEVVRDKNQKRGNKVVNGISCMTCHNQGMLDKADKIRATAEANPAFSKDEVEIIKALYPADAKFQELLTEDKDRFRKAVELTGAQLSQTEPVFALASQFEKEVDLKLAAAEVGVSVEAFIKGLDQRSQTLLGRELGSLRARGNTVQREEFVKHFAELAAVLLPDGQFRRGKDIEPPDDKLLTFDLGNTVKLEMLKINAKGKKFQMGSPKEEADRNPVEAKFDAEEQHEVSFNRDFYMGKFEVTQEQYEAIVGTNPSKFKGAKNPVEMVSWDDAQEFVKKLNAKFNDRKVTFRLPSEAEWEYACRAGTTTPFHFGKELNGKQANSDGDFPYGTTVTGPNLKKTTSVGSYDKNDFGLHDMHGNVREWCEDYYGEYKATPKDGIAQKIKQSDDVRVMRGGSGYSVSRYCRSASRSSYAPGDRDAAIGFRVAYSPHDR